MSAKLDFSLDETPANANWMHVALPLPLALLPATREQKKPDAER